MSPKKEKKKEKERMWLGVNSSSYVVYININIFISCCFIDSVFQFRKGELRMQSLTFDDAGMYQCIAENMHGIIYANAELKIVGQWDCFSIFCLKVE